MKKLILAIRKTLTRGTHFDKSQPAVWLMCFLSSQMSVLGSVCPLGASLFAAAFGSAQGYINALFVLLGTLLCVGINRVNGIGKYIFAMALFALLYEKLKIKNKEKPFVRAALMSLSITLSGILFLVGEGVMGIYPLIYDLLLLGIEAAIAFVSTLAFGVAMPLIRNIRIRRTLGSEEVLSLVYLLGTTFIGLSKFTQLGVINIGNMLCILTVLLFAVRLGAAPGAAAGIVVGLLSGVGGGVLSVTGLSYAFASLAAGLTAKLSVTAACASFIMANALVTTLANGSTEVLINLYDILGACIILRAVPPRFWDYITGFAAQGGDSDLLSCSRLYHDFVLRSVSECLGEARTVLCVLDAKRRERLCPEIALLFDRVARRACGNCGLKKHCWGRELRLTYESLSKMLETCSSGGTLTDDTLPSHCLRTATLKESFLSSFDLYKTDKQWAHKLADSERTSREALGFVTRTLSAIREKESGTLDFDAALSATIRNALDKYALRAESLVALRESGTLEIFLSGCSCGGKGLCDGQLRDVLSAVCGTELERVGARRCDECRLCFMPRPQISIDTAVAGAIKSKRRTSGDFALCRRVSRNTYAIALCDGMGSGTLAAAESRGMAEVLLGFLETGVEPAVAINAVNSLFFCASETTFSTVDLCLIDLRDGTSKLFKSGGAATFTKRGSSVDAIYSTSLPGSALVGGKVEAFDIPSANGDFLVLITDGVIDCAADKAKNDDWLKNVLSSYSGSDAKRLCDMILERAKQMSGEELRDDITVIAAKISKDGEFAS
ncbi:MAG: SpoIIE family protein phosphatase [Clostridia bacterium]|nr:SpoIIE family protein phosphatase [Clostridia bacterium]